MNFQLFSIKRLSIMIIHMYASCLLFHVSNILCDNFKYCFDNNAFICISFASYIFCILLYRCVHITDIGVGYISTMVSLSALFLRWCSQLRDFGLQHLCVMRSLQVLSVAGKIALINLTN